MTQQHALQILDNAAGQAHLTRNDHITVQQAIGVLRDAIQPQPDPAPTAPTDTAAPGN